MSHILSFQVTYCRILNKYSITMNRAYHTCVGILARRAIRSSGKCDGIPRDDRTPPGDKRFRSNHCSLDLFRKHTQHSVRNSRWIWKSRIQYSPGNLRRIVGGAKTEVGLGVEWGDDWWVDGPGVGDVMRVGPLDLDEAER